MSISDYAAFEKNKIAEICGLALKINRLQVENNQTGSDNVHSVTFIPGRTYSSRPDQRL